MNPEWVTQTQAAYEWAAILTLAGLVLVGVALVALYIRGGGK